MYDSYKLLFDLSLDNARVNTLSHTFLFSLCSLTMVTVKCTILHITNNDHEEIIKG